MIIYPFDPKELDDKTLDKKIKAIAQVLCNVHFKIAFNKKSPDGVDTLDFLSSLVKGIPCGLGIPIHVTRAIRHESNYRWTRREKPEWL